MKKESILTIMVLAMAALLLSSVPVLAQAEKTDFFGTLCQLAVDPGTTTVLKSGRVTRKDGWATFDVFTDDPRVTGEFYAYDCTFNLSPAVPVSCPIEASGREGLVHSNFILTPSDSNINGTWEGWWQFMYTIEDGCVYGTLTANGHGTGDLDGLKIRVYAKQEFYAAACAALDANGWPRPLFNGYILTPASVDGE